LFDVCRYFINIIFKSTRLEINTLAVLIAKKNCLASFGLGSLTFYAAISVSSFSSDTLLFVQELSLFILDLVL